MNVLFISECSGQALKETRRILDQFAERRGERTWQTAITKDGLDTVRKLLRKSARKNSAIACHWIRGIDHSELVWLVGNVKRFNSQGAVPTNTTERDVLRENLENNWHTLRDIYLLAALASLLHDLGKACQSFQNRLKNVGEIKRNIYRHEWISLRLFQAFVSGDETDRAWLSRLANPSADDDSTWLERLEKDGLSINTPTPFAQMPPLAKAIGWLVLTHHRLPQLPLSKADGIHSSILDRIPDCIEASWNENNQEQEKDAILPYWQFPHGLPVTTRLWRERAAKIATRILNRKTVENDDNFLDNAYVMHLARLSLMLADHTYSALAKDDAGRVEGQKSYPLFANTDANGSLKQQLDEHLLGVEKLSGQAVYALPEITNKLPRLARHRGLRKRSSDERFRWQDKAAEMAESIRTRSEKQGAFIVNMASTGCGKTLANVRVMYGLSDPTQGMRCAFALGLRTLTRQTAKEYRERLNLGEDEIAALVGGTASSALMKHFSQKAESTGSESLQDLLPEDGHVFYEGTIDDRSIFKTLLKDSRTKALLSAPVLVCTIDHLIPATEGTRGGRQIAPMLRLLSGDVVMDELDDYSIEDLPAVTRLMHWAGLLGSRVLISSATLPPELTVGMFNAYYNGRMQFQRNRAERPNETLSVSCIWIDEFGCSQSDCATSKEYSKVNQEFVEKRIGHLSKTPVLRRGELVPLLTLSKKNESFPSGEKNSIREGFANVIRDCILRLHQQHHETDPKSGKRVSFGVVRMSNIDPLFDVAQKLYQLGAPENHHIHLCVYHSQFPLLSRSAIESQLDKALDRRQPSAVFTLPEIRKHIDSVEAYAKEDQIFVVLSSPVTEVGRDHDYDWAVVEPSSMRSIIQIAGRVRRHRKSICETPNLLLLDKNVRSLEHTGEIAYTRPGYESTKFPLASHSLSDLLREEEFTIIDARPRIVLKQELHSQKRIADLEHARLRALMTPPPVRELSAREIRSGVSTTPSIEAHSWWTQPRAMMSGILQQRQPFRRQLEEQVDLVLLPNEENDDYLLYQIMTTKYGLAQEILVDATKHTRVHLNAGKNVSPWGNADFITVLDMLAEELNMAPINCARRFATITLPQNPDGWRFHPALGFAKYRPALNRF